MSYTEPPASRGGLLPLPASILAADRPAHGMPFLLTELIDRTEELAAVTALLREPAVRLLTLTGPGGVGKTRLAIAAGAELSDDFSDGSVFVDLARIVDAGLVVATIARTVGLRDTGGRPLQHRLLDVLTDAHLLLVLDNFEHVVVAAPELLKILAAGPRVTILVTSRIRLRLSGEREFPVPPFASPSWENPGSAEGFEQNAALQLFSERARAVSPQFILNAETLRSVSEIVRYVDGLPLAIELAAARTKVLPPAALLEHLERRLPLLSGGPRDLPMRQQTMRDTIGWSYDLLTPAEQFLFRRLATFAGGFSLEGARALGPSLAVVDEPGFRDRYDVLEGVTSLVEHSLLGKSAGPKGELRYRMLETIREFGLDRLQDSGEGEIRAAREAHAAYILALTANLRERFYAPDHEEALARLDIERDNSRAALRWAVDANEAEFGLRLSTALSAFWFSRGYYQEGQHWLEQILGLPGSQSADLRAEALMSAGFMATNRGDVNSAEPLFTEAIDIARALEIPRVEAFAMMGMGMTDLQRGLHLRAAEWTDMAIARFQEIERHESEISHYLSVAYSNRGLIAHSQGDFAAATTYLEEAEQRQRSLNFWAGLCDTLSNLGALRLDQGELQQAVTLFRESLQLALDHRHSRCLAEALSGLALVAIAQRAPEHAAQLLGAAEAVRQQVGASVKGWHRDALERGVREAKAALSAEAYAAAFSVGRTLALDAALAEAFNDTWFPETLGARSWPVDPMVAAGLTPREGEVLRLLAEGLSDREIGSALSISERTAGNHVTHILQKLNLDSRTAAAVFAVRHDLA